jgi:hypothetical protein
MYVRSFSLPGNTDRSCQPIRTLRRVNIVPEYPTSPLHSLGFTHKSSTPSPLCKNQCRLQNQYGKAIMTPGGDYMLLSETSVSPRNERDSQ